MAGESEPHGYTYPNQSADPDRIDVLRNRFDIRGHEALREAEYRATSDRRIEIELGGGPRGAFDAAHLKAIHRHLFGDVYEWAGRTREERPIVDGQAVEPIGVLRKGDTSFLHGSRISMGLEEALRPIGNPDALKGSTPAAFAEMAGRVLSELNYVHPFREGNGRTQETFITELGKHAGHYVDFSVITKPRMIAASIASIKDPDHQAMRQLVEDAVDPARVRALKAAFDHLKAQGEDPYEHDVRTARPNETLTGGLLAKTAEAASLITDQGIVAIPPADLPQRRIAEDEDITVTVRSRFGQQTAESYWSRLADKSASTPSRAADTLQQTETQPLKPRR